jgi:pimeloyl-ACP methyl ester carboxylesterase
MAEQTGAETFLRQQRAIMGRVDSRPSLAGIACPTLIVWGRQDGITTEGHQAELLDGIPGARLEVIEDCGHLATLEKPRTVTRLLCDWLDL